MGNAQVESNHKIYNEQYRHEMERDHSGRVALMHDGEIVGIYDDDDRAYWDGCKKYGLGNFSLEWIGAEPVRLGILTAALQ